jgi:hypothetical protein
MWCGILVSLFLFGCSENSLKSQQAKIEDFARKNRFGSSSDQWLVKLNAFGEWEKLALVYGLADDKEFCEKLARFSAQDDAPRRYRCEPAN